MTTFTFDSKDPQGLLYVLGEASIEFDNAGAPLSKALIDELRDQLRPQVKPAIEEPTEFGSIVRARADAGREPVQVWTLSPRTGNHCWQSETGVLAVWSELTDIEVLRVGIGDSPEAEYHRGYEAGYGEGVNWGLAANRKPAPYSFCGLSALCRMARGHVGPCQR